MRICMITGDWPPSMSGVADGMKTFAEFITREPSFHLDILTTKGFDQYSDYRENLKVHAIVDKWAFSDMRAVLDLIKEIRPDIVHIQYPTFAYQKRVFINVLPLVLRILGYHVVITIHEYSFNLTWKGRVRMWPSILGAQRILAADPVYIKDIRRVFPWKRMDTVPIASNIPETQLDQSGKRELRESLGIPEKKILLGFFGFINRNKLLEPALEAIKALKEEHRLEAGFLFIGDMGPDREAIDALNAKIDGLGIRPDCVMTGRLPEDKVADYLSILDYAVMIYSSGLSPRNATFLAALSQGIKVITGLNPGYTPEFDNVYEIAMDAGMPREIVNIVIANKHKAVSQDSQGFYESGWEKFCDKHRAIYRELL